MLGVKYPRMGISLILVVLAVPGYNMLTKTHAPKHRLGVGGNFQVGSSPSGSGSVSASVTLNHDPCRLTYCGPLSVCTPGKYVGKCACAPEAVGKPPFCRHPCNYDVNCPKDKVCLNNTCVDPCDNECGDNAMCHVDPTCDGILGDGLTSHAVHTLTLNPCKRLPVCTCPEKFKGDPKIVCVAESPCDKEVDPCGPNSVCQPFKGAAMCSCEDGFMGPPPSCKHECEENDDCSSEQACVENMCVNPCAGACEPDELCHVEDREATCTQPQCDAVTEGPQEMRDPCDPTPCGPNSDCVARNSTAICSCQAGNKGPPPNCKKYSPCDISPCGPNSVCLENEGTSICICEENTTGTPTQCKKKG